MIWLLSLQKVKLNSIVSVYCCITTSTIVESLMEVNMYSHTFFLPFFLFIKLSQYVMGNWFSNVYFSENISESYKVILWFASFFSLFIAKGTIYAPYVYLFTLAYNLKLNQSFPSKHISWWTDLSLLISDFLKLMLCGSTHTIPRRTFLKIPAHFWSIFGGISLITTSWSC